MPYRRHVKSRTRRCGKGRVSSQIFSLSCSLVPSAHQIVPILAPRNRTEQQARTACNSQFRAVLRDDFLNLRNVGPLLELYPHLIPPKKLCLKKEGVNKRLKKPPLIHCRYVADKEFLFDYARNHGLLRECPGKREGEMSLLSFPP